MYAESEKRVKRSLYVGLDGQPISGGEAIDLLADIDVRRVAAHEVVSLRGDLWFVSTVHTVIDYRFMGDGPPICWETMIFFEPAGGGRTWNLQHRYSNRELAALGHECAVPLAFEHIRDQARFDERWDIRMRAHGVIKDMPPVMSGPAL